MRIDPEEAEKVLRNAFYAVKDEIGVTCEDIDFFINKDCISSVQSDREAFEDDLRKLKVSLQKKFNRYRINARVKSLYSIFGKLMEDRTLSDTFGIKVITNNIRECYAMKKWLDHEFTIKKFDNRIMNPKPNGYSDLQIVVDYMGVDVEFIIQTKQMYVDSHTLQPHDKAYPWKYRPEMLNLPSEYRQMSL